ncbi:MULTISPECIES: sugar transferase [Paenibacillus]|jgi:lipopolysaccharide/colanic/teichoic acid biosynthesis glycosyltransferase|uniref:sugar transferase n=1 Tax=Paenibacillus TaxID=44249 RepID=UPI0003E2A446|nr:sugar transferase [Paenibacillus sp. FSL R5-192]MBD8838745.1 sugar transferase [Paenibacillus sp. CFBP 13594]MBY0115034.1 sugar transferase [Paenibacillus xylanexedens]MDQ0658092.1 lipopolysaccharide/colanic/teichoic acid biosynthesis glycosyltransferase [Paenibacillus sp. W2I17]PRA08448.1 sugar transferase [Paenibacillus sp. MYb63]PRA42276.1 sugar transferase [Paenibacillus sp. MYb67]QZN78294.1 sugar transferase [Paenibacillus sp. DR312]TDL64437.1 sugar transferase [Paenibacillus amyloly
MSPSPQTKEAEIVMDPSLGYNASTMSGQNADKVYLFMKRMLDLLGSFIGLIILCPLFAVIGLLIKIEAPQGSVFFRQVRVGQNGKEFHMYKFRSMVANAEDLLEQLIDQNEVNGNMFKMKNDPRITRIGKFIRKTSLDELPQLWNVFRGEMSLVGPRPALPREVKNYTSYDRQRLQMIPGCTGLWQVSGRNSVGFEEMVELDLTYARERSMMVDIKIIFRTFKVLVGSKDAF